MNPNRAFDLILFDWDGTLMDSTATIAACIQAACVAVGEPEPPLERAKHVIGLGLKDALMICAPLCPPSKYPDLAMHYRDAFLQQDAHLQFFDGALPLLTSLKSQGYLLTVATGKNRIGLDRVLAHTGIGHFFATTRTADETQSKPHPRMVHETLDQLGIPAHRALVVGDTTHDILMAHQAGVRSVGLTQGAHDASKLATAQPTVLLERIDQLQDWLSQQSSA